MPSEWGFANTVRGKKKSRPHSFFTKALVVNTVVPVAPVQTQIRMSLYQPPRRKVRTFFLSLPVEVGPQVIPVPPGPDPPPVIIPVPTPTPTPGHGHPKGSHGGGPKTKGTLTLNPITPAITPAVS